MPMNARLWMGTLAVLSCFADTVGGQAVPWYPPPAVTFLELDDRRFPNDLLVLDALIRTPDRLRLFRTTAGLGAGPSVTPGELLAVDVVIPIPMILDIDGFDGTGWAAGATSWEALVPVANWNAALNPGSTGIGKGNAQQGLVSRDGNLYVAVRRNTAETEEGPRWNGLARVSGTATPHRAFQGAAGELFSTAMSNQAAGPEGTAISSTASGDTFLFACNHDGADAAGRLRVQVITDPAHPQLGEAVDIDVFDMLGAYTSQQTSFGSYGYEVPRHWFDDPGASASPGDKLRAAAILVVNGDQGSFPNAGRTFLVLGLDLDPVWPPVNEHLIDDDPATPGQQPLDINDGYLPLDGSSWLDGPQGTRDDGKYDYLSFTDITDMWSELISGWYAFEGGQAVERWSYASPEEWRDHTTFLRLPADYPPTEDTPNEVFPCTQLEWASFDTPVPCPYPPSCGSDLDFGRDWSGPATCPVMVVGSGTIASIVPHPQGTFLYAVTCDEDVDAYYETPLPGAPQIPDVPIADRDGGWHVPHLYALDLSQVDLGDQASLDYNASYYQPDDVTPNPDGFAPDWLEARRLNKMLVARAHCTISPSGADVWGFVPYFAPSENTHPTVLSQNWLGGLHSAPEYGDGYTSAHPPTQLPDPGVAISYENYYEPTPRARLVAVHNDALATAENRLYLGMNGWVVDPIGVVDGVCLPGGGGAFSPASLYSRRFNAGIVLSLALPDGHNQFGQPRTVSGLPVARRPVYLPFKDTQGLPLPRTFIVCGMDSLPVTSQVLQVSEDPLGVSTQRTILGVLGRDRRDVFVSGASSFEHRLFLCEDP